MSKYFLFALAVFTNYRLSRMLGIEDGPFAIFLKGRDKVFERYGNGWLHEGVSCPVCIGFWTALFLSLLLHRQYKMNFFFLWFGLSGMSTFLYRSENN